jgi:hypothetical protein
MQTCACSASNGTGRGAARAGGGHGNTSAAPPTKTASDVQVLVLPTRDTAALAVAAFWRRRCAESPEVVLGLPTGRTMIPVLSRSGASARKRPGRLRPCHHFQSRRVSLDFPLGHPGSFHAYMREHLFEHVNLPRGASHFSTVIRGRRGVRTIGQSNAREALTCVWWGSGGTGTSVSMSPHQP